jgi:hypothetical protein
VIQGIAIYKVILMFISYSYKCCVECFMHSLTSGTHTFRFFLKEELILIRGEDIEHYEEEEAESKTEVAVYLAAVEELVGCHSTLPLAFVN